MHARVEFYDTQSDKRSKVEAVRNSLPTPELLWEMHVNKKSDPPLSPSATKPSTVDMRRANSNIGKDIRSSTPSRPPVTESPWESHMTKKKGSPLAPVESNSESLWELHEQRNKVMAEPPTPPESPWNTQMSKNFQAGQKGGLGGINAAESLWDTHVGMRTAPKDSLAAFPQRMLTKTRGVQ